MTNPRTFFWRAVLLVIPIAATMSCIGNPRLKPAEFLDRNPPLRASTPASTDPVADHSKRRQSRAPGIVHGGLFGEEPWDRMRRGFRLTGESHSRISAEVERYSRRRSGLEILLQQGLPYLAWILDQVETRELPSELALIPAVESGFDTRARSHRGALGLWQIMPATGRRFGLHENWWYEPRMDAAAATDAALDYLEYLHRRFQGDWLLALAAYNAGEGAIAGAIRRAGTTGQPDFWSLDLPRETAAYVPRILALARLIQHPQHHDLALPGLDHPRRLAAVDIPHQLPLIDAARFAALPVAELRKLNGGLRRNVTPPGPARLLLPAPAIPEFRRQLAELTADYPRQWSVHRIRGGDTLSELAEEYDTTVAMLRRANGLQNNRIRADSILVVPATAAVRESSDGANGVSYQVRRGDTLWGIAQRFQTDVDNLKLWNALTSDRLRPGQVLRLWARH